MAELKIGTKIDRYYKMRDEIRDLEKAVKVKKKKYEEMETEIMADLNKNKLNGSKGNKLGQVSITKKEFVVVDDPNAFNKYVLRNRALDLYQRRISITAYKERTDAGKKIPGTHLEAKRSLHLTALKKTE